MSDMRRKALGAMPRKYRCATCGASLEGYSSSWGVEPVESLPCWCCEEGRAAIVEEPGENPDVSEAVGDRRNVQGDVVSAEERKAMTNIVDRLRDRPNDHHLTSEYLMDEAAKVIETAAYYIDRLERCHAGKPVRDLDEAQSAYLNSLKPSLTK